LTWIYSSQNHWWENDEARVTAEIIAHEKRELVENMLSAMTSEPLPEEAWPTIRDPDTPTTVAEMEALIIRLLRTPRIEGQK